MNEPESNFYLSVIIAVRNDNYGGDFNKRLSFSLKTLSGFVQKYQLSTELVLVNYNYLNDRPDLISSVDFPEQHPWLTINVVQVPSQIHQMYLDQGMRKPVPMFEFIAKNIGIVRAKGQFLLCTNADIVFSESLIAFLAQKTLQKGILYRSDRYDFTTLKDDESNKSLEENEKNIEKKVFKFFLKDGTFTLRRPLRIDKRLNLLNKWNAFRRWYYFNLLKIPFFRNFPGIPKISRKQVFLFHHHCNASGDFALMARIDWMNIRGYLEDTWISTHTDSLMVICSVVSGITIEMLPHPVYHQHHARRFDFGKADKDMDHMYKRLLSDANMMLESGNPQRNRHEIWGLSNENLDIIKLT